MTNTFNPLEAKVEASSPLDSPNPLPPEIAAVVDGDIPQESAKLMTLESCQLIAAMKDRLTEVARAAEIMRIVNEEDSKDASATVILARKTKKQLGDKRLELTRPLDDQKSAIRAPFVELEEAFDRIDKTLSPKVARYQDEVEARRIAAEREAKRIELEALKAKEAEQIEQAKEAQSELAKDDAIATREQIEELETYDPAKDPSKVATRTVVGSTHRRKDLEIEIVAQNKVARRYIRTITVDRAAVKADWKKGKREFPGLAVKEISTLGIR